MEAKKIKVPKPTSLSSLSVDPLSLSLSLSHSDSSISLYPSLSLPISLPQQHTHIPPLNSCSAFIHLKNKNPVGKTLFLSSSSSSVNGGGGRGVLFRFWVLMKNTHFAKARVFCDQKGLTFDEAKFGVVFDVGCDDIRLFSTTNVFAVYSGVENKIWVFGVREVGSGGGLKLMRCSVIECGNRVFSMSLDFGFLMLGEESGVRVFGLRPLVKGRVKKESGKSKNYASAKVKSVKLKQDSKEYGACFVEFENKENDTEKQTKEELLLAKANSIKALSPDKFLVLDSIGDLHLLRLSSNVVVSENPFSMKRLANIMKAQKLAVLPDISTKTRYVWISDGYHTVHAIAFPGVDVSVTESSTDQPEDQQIQSSVSQAIFTSEKIQEMVPLATNAVLILGQGSLFVYSIP